MINKLFFLMTIDDFSFGTGIEPYNHYSNKFNWIKDYVLSIRIRKPSSKKLEKMKLECQQSIKKKVVNFRTTPPKKNKFKNKPFWLRFRKKKK